jgi:hypothetical protein
MLRITVVAGRTQLRLVAEGVLISPWVAELRTAWRRACMRAEGRKLVLDLRDVTQISEEGEIVLSELMNEGATFSCSGALTKHILQELKRKKGKAKQIILAPSAAVGATKPRKGK